MSTFLPGMIAWPLPFLAVCPMGLHPVRNKAKHTQGLWHGRGRPERPEVNWKTTWFKAFIFTNKETEAQRKRWLALGPGVTGPQQALEKPHRLHPLTVSLLGITGRSWGPLNHHHHIPPTGEPDPTVGPLRGQNGHQLRGQMRLGVASSSPVSPRTVGLPTPGPCAGRAVTFSSSLSLRRQAPILWIRLSSWRLCGRGLTLDTPPWARVNDCDPSLPPSSARNAGHAVSLPCDLK